MSADDERFDAKTAVLIENVIHHIEKEEKEWFPEVREWLLVEPQRVPSGSGGWCAVWHQDS